MRLASALVGRDRELAVLDEFLAADGEFPAALVLEGDAGIGKTTLWREGVASAAARGFRVLAGQAAASEAELGFAVLADLLEEPALDLRAALPPAQWRVLEVAVLLAEPGPDPAQPRAIGVAFLAALRLLARERPLLVAVDDVQWVDPASRAMLEFAARRLKDERVGLLLARRLEGDSVTPFALDRALPPDRLTQLRVGPLSLGALHEVLRNRLDVTFARPILRKLAETSAGNPFFALELARAAARHGGHFDPDEVLPLPETLQALVADRLEALPPASCEALLIASLASDPSVALIAQTLTGDAWQRVRPAVEAEILELDGERIRFAHPLLASVTEATADLGRRREAHRLIADAVPDPEERALHLSLAADGPSATVASALEQAAKHAHDRGATDAAAVLAERAARLTPPDRPSDARRRTLQAAESHFDAGSIGRAQILLERVATDSPSGPLRAEALTRLGTIRLHGYGSAAAMGDLAAALAEAGDDVKLLTEIERSLAWAHHHAGDLATACTHVRSAVELAERLRDPARLASALATLAFMEFVAGRGLDTELIERAVALEPEHTPVVERGRWTHALLLEWMGEHRQARSLLEHLQVESVDRGEDVELPFVANHLARLALRAGDWVRAERMAAETLEQTLQMGLEEEQTFALASSSLVEAHFSRVESARELAQHGLTLAERNVVEPARFELLAALGFLELSLGDAEAAHRVLGPLVDAVAMAGFGEPAVFRFHTDEVEALLALGRLEEAAARLAGLDAHAQAVPSPWLLATAARCRGVLEAAHGDIDGAVETLVVAKHRAAELGEPFELARTLLALGTVQRRAKRWSDARGSLEQASRTFARLGAHLWVERAQADLERVPGRAPAGGELTPTEQRVAELVAQGRRNKEVAAALFVTVKAVEANLSRVYAKLGIRSRAELVHRFARESEPKL